MGTTKNPMPTELQEVAATRLNKPEPKPLGPDSLTWQGFGSHIYFLTLPEAFILQAAHPVINSAVTTTNKFRTDPWGRAKASLDMLWPTVYARPEVAIENGRRVREWHRPIKGVDKHGNKFHALDPEAYSWVHMTAFDASIRTHKYFSKDPLTREQRRQLFDEWKQMGDVLGVDPRFLPKTEAEYWVAYNRMIDERLVDTEVLHHGLHLREFISELPKPAAFDKLPEFVWKAMATLPAVFYSWLIRATLPDNFRKKFDVKYSFADRIAFNSFAWTVRHVFPLIPESKRYIPTAWRAIKDAREHPEAYRQAI